MKKVTLLAIALFTLLSSYAQVFDGVPIAGKFYDCINKFKSKGYTLKEEAEYGATMTGKIGTDNVELYIFKTPKTGLVYKISVFLPKKTTWNQLKSSFIDYVNLLVGKYGDYDKSAAYFDDPYDEGDGYEMSAVTLEKCKYYAYWSDHNNTNIFIEISKYTQVKIAYENVANLKLREIEKEQIQRNIF